ncbi:hypothetical protein CJ030_MR1G027867 [Morella rubra]|uniref:Uncharacterized protein n=1 Tax=Morella rubra TaxID=262757 RepID=A0A6A1WKQ5_9ROSI|nr:hypothetical protein CJ030_MR1G027867 [Morella rubra]
MKGNPNLSPSHRSAITEEGNEPVLVPEEDVVLPDVRRDVLPEEDVVLAEEDVVLPDEDVVLSDVGIGEGDSYVEDIAREGEGADSEDEMSNVLGGEFEEADVSDFSESDEEPELYTYAVDNGEDARQASMDWFGRGSNANVDTTEPKIVGGSDDDIWVKDKARPSNGASQPTSKTATQNGEPTEGQGSQPPQLSHGSEPQQSRRSPLKKTAIEGQVSQPSQPLHGSEPPQPSHTAKKITRKRKDKADLVKCRCRPLFTVGRSPCI